MEGMAISWGLWQQSRSLSHRDRKMGLGFSAEKYIICIKYSYIYNIPRMFRGQKINFNFCCCCCATTKSRLKRIKQCRAAALPAVREKSENGFFRCLQRRQYGKEMDRPQILPTKIDYSPQANALLLLLLCFGLCYFALPPNKQKNIQQSAAQPKQQKIYKNKNDIPADV